MEFLKWNGEDVPVETYRRAVDCLPLALLEYKAEPGFQSSPEA